MRINFFFNKCNLRYKYKIDNIYIGSKISLQCKIYDGVVRTVSNERKRLTVIRKEVKEEDEKRFHHNIFFGVDLSPIHRRRESEKREHSPSDDTRIRREFSRVSESEDSSIQDEPENLSSDKRDENNSPLSESTEDKFIFRRKSKNYGLKVGL